MAKVGAKAPLWLKLAPRHEYLKPRHLIMAYELLYLTPKREISR